VSSVAKNDPMTSSQRTLTPGNRSNDELLRLQVDPAIWKQYVDTRSSFNKCSTAYAKEWELDLYSKGSPNGGGGGAMKYRHKACGGLHGVSNFSKVAKAHKCDTVGATDKETVFYNLSSNCDKSGTPQAFCHQVLDLLHIQW
jgi:hypothetical protein